MLHLPSTLLHTHAYTHPAGHQPHSWKSIRLARSVQQAGADLAYRPGTAEMEGETDRASQEYSTVAATFFKGTPGMCKIKGSHTCTSKL